MQFAGLPIGGAGGRVDSSFDSCSKYTGLNPAEAGHCVHVRNNCAQAIHTHRAWGRRPASIDEKTFPKIKKRL